MIEKCIPKHIAIIMDGNGRWAKKRGLPRTAGHKVGAENVCTIAKACNKLGVKELTLYAFSTENWKRPEDEVNYLCKLPKLFFSAYIKELKKNRIRVTFLGELERFPPETQKVILDAIEATKDFEGLNLCIAINYGGRREIVLAAQKYAQDVLNQKASLELSEQEFSQYLMTKDMHEVDLMIRTSGEERISNFLLWQLAYSEFIFTPVAWPDFNEDELTKCIDEFTSRNRRFGGV